MEKKDIKKLIEDFAESTSIIAKQCDGYFTQLQQFAESFAKSNEKLFSKMEEIVSHLATLPLRTSELQSNLQKRGWFMLSEIPIDYFYEMEADFSKGNLYEVDNKMIEAVKAFFDDIETQLINKFPARESIIREGFENHRCGRFASSITLLLTQVDGICFELFEHLYFSLDRNTRLPRTRKPIESLGLDSVQQIFLKPLMERIGINANDNEFGIYPDTFHRHEVLHGKDINYANEINSLKIISLLGYLGGTVCEIVSESTIEEKPVTI